MFRGCQLLMKIVSPRRSKGQHNNSNGTPGPFTNGRRGIARERKISRVTIQRRRELIGTRRNADHERFLRRAIFRHSSEFHDFYKNTVRRGRDEQCDEILNDHFSLLSVNSARKGDSWTNIWRSSLCRFISFLSLMLQEYLLRKEQLWFCVYGLTVELPIFVRWFDEITVLHYNTK